MKQRVFGSHRTLGEELIKLAGPAAEGFEAVYPYDPTRNDRPGSISFPATRRGTTNNRNTSLPSPTIRCASFSTRSAAPV